jgi:hypothetical protein
VRDVDRNIVASAAFAAFGGVDLALTSTRDVFGWIVIGLGALGVVLGVILRARTKPGAPRA